MNRIILPSKNIKYIKLCIISQHYEIITTLVYIITFFLLSFHLLLIGKNLSNYHSNKIVDQLFERDAFMTITKESELLAYLDTLVKYLYTYDPDKQINVVIPFGSIRLKKYSHRKGDCPFDTVKKCNDYVCTMEELNRLYGVDSHCGSPYNKAYADSPSGNNKTIYTSLTRNYGGKHSAYDLVNDGHNYDFTIDEYSTPEGKGEIEAFIHDPDLKFIAIMFNVYFPTSEHYALVMGGIEMVHFFSFPHPVFTSSIYNFFNANDAYFITVYVLFCVSVGMICLKLLYEVNVKCMMAVHVFSFVNEAINILYIIFISFYFSSVLSEPSIFNSVNQKQFRDNIPTIVLNSYLQIIISVLFLCMPFKLLSLFSWYQKGSSYFVTYFSVIFRILPGILVLASIIIMLILVFAFINFFMYNGNLFMCENIFNSLSFVFDYQDIRNINLSKYLEHSISNSKYFLLFNVIQNSLFIIVIGITIATIVYLIRKASKLENEDEEEEDEVMKKLGQIEALITDEIINDDENLNGMKKQILWLNLGNKNDLYNTFAEKQRVLLFKKSQHVIAFLKYLFAIKPDMQFKKLNDKFGLVIECKVINSKLKDTELEQIYILLDWLNFVGCKIPSVLYTIDRIERNLRMKLATCYMMLKFLSHKDELYAFISTHIHKTDQDDDKKKLDIDHMIAYTDQFIIYPTQISQGNICNTTKRTFKHNISLANSVGNKSNADDDSGHLNSSKNHTYMKQLTKKPTIESVGNNTNKNLNNSALNTSGIMPPKTNNYLPQKSINNIPKEKENILHLNQSISEEKIDDSNSVKSLSSDN